MPLELPEATIEIDEFGLGAYFADWPMAVLSVSFLLELGLRSVPEPAERFELRRGYLGEGGRKVVEDRPWLSECGAPAFAHAIVEALVAGELNAGEVSLGGARGGFWLECVQRAPFGLIAFDFPSGWQDGFQARFEAVRAAFADRLEVYPTWEW